MTGASTPDDIRNFLRYLCSVAHRQRVFFLWRPWLKDPQDDMVLEAAVASQSRYIITHNLRDFTGSGVTEHFGIMPIRPRGFYTASGVKRYEYDHRPITEVLTCQN